MKKLVAILVVAWLGAGIGAVMLWQKLDALRDRNVSLLARVNVLETPAQPGITFVAQAQGAATAPADAAPLAAAGEAAADPALSEMNRTMLRRVLIQQYPDLEQELSLSPAELEKLLDLLADQRTSQSSKQGQEAVAALLGSRYALWQDYQQTLPARRQVNQLRGQLAASGGALSNEQARPLLAALSAEQKRIDQDAQKNRPQRGASESEMMERELQRAVEGNRRLVEAATPHLNAQQLDGYRRMLEQQTEMARAMMPMLQSLSAEQNKAGKQN